MAIIRHETTQADWQQGTLSGVVATASGDLQLSTVGTPTFDRSSVAYKLNGTQVSSGLPRFEPSNFGSALVIEETTNNLLSANRASVETNTSGFSSLGTGTTIARDTSTFWHGVASLRVTTTGSASGQGFSTTSVSVTASNTYTASIYLKGSGTVLLALQELNSSNELINETVSSPITLTDSWQRVTVTRAFGSSGVRARIQVRTNSAQAITFWADGLQLEQKAYPTSWQLGGTSRSAETLTIPTAGVLNAQGGTIECLIRLLRNPGTNAQYIFHGAGSTNRSLLIYVGTDGKLRCDYGTGSTTLTIVGTTVLTSNTDYAIAFRWSPSGVALFLNGVLEASSSTPPNFAFDTNAYLGSTSSRTLQLDGLLDEFRISSRARTDEEIIEAAQNGQKFPLDKDTTYKLNFDGNLVCGKGGYRVSPPLDLSPVEVTWGGTVSWTATTPTGTSVIVEVSLDGGATWHECTNGGTIPGISPGDDLTGASLLVRQTLITSDTSVTPTLSDLTVLVGSLRTGGATVQATALTESVSPTRIRENLGIAVSTVLARVAGRTVTYAEGSTSAVVSVSAGAIRTTPIVGDAAAVGSSGVIKVMRAKTKGVASASFTGGAVRMRTSSGDAAGGSTFSASALRYLLRALAINAVIQPGDLIEIDTARMTVKINGVNALHLIDGDFFNLLPGTNHLEFQDSEQSREVQIITRHRPRWL